MRNPKSVVTKATQSVYALLGASCDPKVVMDDRLKDTPTRCVGFNVWGAHSLEHVRAAVDQFMADNPDWIKTEYGSSHGQIRIVLTRPAASPNSNDYHDEINICYRDDVTYISFGTWSND